MPELLTKNYTRLALVPFGQQLLRTGDLDPVYLALRGTSLKRPQLDRWLIAYWYFYDCGFASYASERTGRDFWQLLSIAAVNTDPCPVGGRWPRGPERRHFRGPKAVSAIRWLEDHYQDRPEGMVEYIVRGGTHINDVIQRATVHPMCGRWVGFKIADMVDAVLGERVEQDDLAAFLYDTVRESIQWNYEDGVILPPPNNADKFEYGMAWLGKQLKDCRIPHKPQSPPDWFSLETVFCKHLSHLRGHYPLYHDTVEIVRRLPPWTRVSPTAASFAQHLPTSPTGELPMRTNKKGKVIKQGKSRKKSSTKAEWWRSPICATTRQVAKAAREQAQQAGEDPDLAEHAAVIRRLSLRCLRDTIEIGRRLCVAKDKVGHGGWGTGLSRRRSCAESALNWRSGRALRRRRRSSAKLRPGTAVGRVPRRARRHTKRCRGPSKYTRAGKTCLRAEPRPGTHTLSTRNGSNSERSEIFGGGGNRPRRRRP
jgi:hypothetical protein